MTNSHCTSRQQQVCELANAIVAAFTSQGVDGDEAEDFALDAIDRQKQVVGLTNAEVDRIMSIVDDNR
jgi:hypothetical protein